MSRGLERRCCKVGRLSDFLSVSTGPRTSTRAWTGPPLALHRQSRHEVRGRFPVQLAQLRQFDGIDLALPSFESGNERLLETEVLGNGFLSHTSFHSGGAEPYEE